MAAKEKPLHHRIAEAVFVKVTPKTRERLSLTPKGSYSTLADETGWVARVTPKVVEFNHKRIEPTALDKAGMADAGKDDYHRLHGIQLAEDGGLLVASDDEEGPKAGVSEVAKAVTAAAKPVKS